MKVTRTDVANTFGVSLERVNQIGAKQLFIVDCSRGRVLVSYKTIVGRFVNNVWRLTTVKYSVTTSKQLMQFRNSTKFSSVYTDNIWSDSHVNN